MRQTDLLPSPRHGRSAGPGGPGPRPRRAPCRRDDALRTRRTAGRSAQAPKRRSRAAVERPARRAQRAATSRARVERIRRAALAAAADGHGARRRNSARRRPLSAIAPERQPQRRRRRRDATPASATDQLARTRAARSAPSPTRSRRRPRPSATVERGGFEGRNRRDYRDGNYTPLVEPLAPRPPLRLAPLSQPPPLALPARTSITIRSAGTIAAGRSAPACIRAITAIDFWLNDPWQYRLPPAYGPYRWVRYCNDALLVNIYTGQVVDVIHGFFW